MKKVLFLLMFPVLCFGQYTSIPDSIFEQRLIDWGYDTIHDGQVLTLNIVNVDSLTFDVPTHLFGNPMLSHQIKDFTGIEDFVSLTFLDCSLNAMDSLDLSQNTALSYLECTGYFLGFTSSYGGELKSLKLGQNTSLTYINCSMQTQLSNLDVSQNTALTHLECFHNNLIHLDLSQNTALTYLNCSGSNILNLDLSQNSALTYLNCSENFMTELNLSQNPFLTEINCRGAFPFQSFGSYPIGTLRHLDLRNNNNINITNLNAQHNPNLHCINVDDSTWSGNSISINVDNHTIFSNNCNNVQYSSSGYTAIFDSNFEQRLIDLGYDSIQDGQVLTSNIINVDSLFLSGTSNIKISNLSGIEDFTNLIYLECDNNPLTLLDLTQNLDLKYLDCRGLMRTGPRWGTLFELNLPQNNTLIHLDCDGNRLFNLDLTQNSALNYLRCGWNNNFIGGLDSLNTSQNPNLNYLDCIYSGIENLFLGQNINLTNLDCSYNNISTLDVSQNISLRHLYCSYNNLSFLDVSQNSVLTQFLCSDNNLTSLDLRNGNNVNFNNVNNTNYPAFAAYNNDSLFCVSVDDSAWSANNWSASIDSHTVFSNNCNPSTVDIVEIEKTLLIYPNPTSEDITISIENFNGNIQTEVYDIVGNRLQTNYETTISLRDYSKGIYILKVAYGDKVKEVKVIKE